MKRCTLTIMLMFCAGATLANDDDPRAREAGLAPGIYEPGTLNAITDVAGVLDDSGELISSLNVAQTGDLLDGGAVKGGMIPKLKTCLQALQDQTDAAHILDGRIPHSLLLEIFTAHGTGTMIVPDD